jgi:disulfide bond formation protein DsbB
MIASFPNAGSWRLLFLAFAVALASSLTVLFVGEVMGQVPCNLCWFQRAFMFPLAIVLAVAAFRSDAAVWMYALPLAAGGWLVAGFHTLLYAGIVPQAIEPCGPGPSCSSVGMTLGGLPLPALSLSSFTAIIACLLLARGRSAS